VPKVVGLTSNIASLTLGLLCFNQENSKIVMENR